MVAKLPLTEVRERVQAELEEMAVLPASAGRAFRQAYWNRRVSHLCLDPNISQKDTLDSVLYDLGQAGAKLRVYRDVGAPLAEIEEVVP